MAGSFLLCTETVSAEVIWGKVRPLKSVHCVCGELIDQSGAPVSDATVTVIKDGKDLETVTTTADGKFIFGDLKSGSYELSAQADGFLKFRSPIVMASPAKKCKQGLVIVMVLPYPDNGGSFVMKQ